MGGNEFRRLILNFVCGLANDFDVADDGVLNLRAGLWVSGRILVRLAWRRGADGHALVSIVRLLRQPREAIDEVIGAPHIAVRVLIFDSQIEPGLSWRKHDPTLDRCCRYPLMGAVR
jgi:hypothetical protein